MTNMPPAEPVADVLAALRGSGVVEPATVRTAVSVPLGFPDGIATAARVLTFTSLADGQEHLLLGLGDWEGAVVRSMLGGPPPLVRPHSECLTGDVFGSERCDCGPLLRQAVERVTEAGGFLLYLRQEGCGIGLYAKLDADALQDAGLLERAGITVTGRIPTGVHLSEANTRSLTAKRDHTAHTLDLPLAG